MGRSMAPQAAAMMACVSPPTSRRTRKDALQNRDRVLDAATELVRRDGEKVPMAKIAERAGVGVGTVYRHFATREDLLGALVHRSFGLAVENAGAAAAHPGPALEGVRLFLLATLRDRERFVLPLHGGPIIFTPATRQRQADVRTALRTLLPQAPRGTALDASSLPVTVWFRPTAGGAGRSGVAGGPGRSRRRWGSGRWCAR